MSEEIKQAAPQQQPAKDRTVQFNQYLNKRCHITFGGVRSVVGTIVGWDSLNLVVNDAIEERSFSQGVGRKPLEYTRNLGQIVVRSGHVSSIFPEDGYEPYHAPATGEDAAIAQ